MVVYFVLSVCLLSWYFICSAFSCSFSCVSSQLSGFYPFFSCLIPHATV